MEDSAVEAMVVEKAGKGSSDPEVLSITPHHDDRGSAQRSQGFPMA